MKRTTTITSFITEVYIITIRNISSGCQIYYFSKLAMLCIPN